MKDTIYFRHDYDAQEDPKIIKLRMKYGWEGYGLYRAILEGMRGDANVLLRECDIDAFAFRLQYDCMKFTEFIGFCVGVGLFIYDEKDKIYYSKRLQEDAEYMRDKSKKAKKSANARWKARSNANALQTQSDGNAINDSIVYDKKGNDNLSDHKKELLLEFVERRNNATIGTEKAFPKCMKVTDDLKKAWATLSKQLTYDDLVQAANNYIVEIKGRKKDGDYAKHRFSLGEFLEQKNGARKFYNYQQ